MALPSLRGGAREVRSGGTGPRSSQRTMPFERGNGLSDWDNPTFSVDAFVRDLEAVVDALGFDQFTLIGSSKGGSTAIAYAALHPERVTRLVLYGTYAQGSRVRGDGAGIETSSQAGLGVTRFKLRVRL